MCRDALEQGAFGDLCFADANDHAAANRLGVREPAKLDHSICMVQPDGVNLWGYDAVTELARWRPATAGLAWVMASRPVARIGRRLYAWVSRNRRWISKS